MVQVCQDGVGVCRAVSRVQLLCRQTTEYKTMCEISMAGRWPIMAAITSTIIFALTMTRLPQMCIAHYNYIIIMQNRTILESNFPYYMVNLYKIYNINILLYIFFNELYFIDGMAFESEDFNYFHCLLITYFIPIQRQRSCSVVC